MISNGLYFGVFWLVFFLRCYRGNTKNMRKNIPFYVSGSHLLFCTNSSLSCSFINIYWLDEAIYNPSHACMCFVEACLMPLLTVTSFALKKPEPSSIFFLLKYSLILSLSVWQALHKPELWSDWPDVCGYHTRCGCIWSWSTPYDSNQTADDRQW